MAIYEIYVQRTVVEEARVTVEASNPAAAYYTAWKKFKADEFHSQLSVKSDETTMCNATRVADDN